MNDCGYQRIREPIRLIRAETDSEEQFWYVLEQLIIEVAGSSEQDSHTQNLHKGIVVYG